MGGGSRSGPLRRGGSSQGPPRGCGTSKGLPMGGGAQGPPKGDSAPRSLPRAASVPEASQGLRSLWGPFQMRKHHWGPYGVGGAPRGSSKCDSTRPQGQPRGPPGSKAPRVSSGRQAR
ncbi:salivary acidic proline-rich phosphoprotein 1/2-like [Homarus americanus]|uniref:salivary acidic proline-rich phosphoprotein 1/2-like n=1 Tax=Homarus americanus TaxID=6706 RepID=UPI001C47E3BE|nr:salivary acidic proline-rich phosphoprotein 1/2-like [Homarus americanus]